MFALEKNGSGVWVISNGMRFSRKTAFTKRLIAVEVFRPTLEQKVSKLALSFSFTPCGYMWIATFLWKKGRLYGNI